MTENAKIISGYKNLAKCIKKCRRKKQKIVLTQGSWDLIHIGHARYIKEAKARGDILVVAVDGDTKIRKRKGPERPVVPQKERIEMISHLNYVDYVILKSVREKKWALIKLLRPDVLIATKETYNKKRAKEVAKFCGKLVILKPQATTSTTAKLRRLQTTAANKIEKILQPKVMKAIESTLSKIKDKNA